MPTGTARYSNVNVDAINDKVFRMGILSTNDIPIGIIKAKITQKANTLPNSATQVFILYDSIRHFPGIDVLAKVLLKKGNK